MASVVEYRKHRNSDFSIESLLKGTTTTTKNVNLFEHETERSDDNDKNFDSDKESDEQNFSWLQCTRFKPPKLPSK